MLYGLNEKRQNYLTKILNATSDKPMKLVNDQFKCPISTDTLVKTLLNVVSKDVVGVIHLAGRDRLSMYGFGQSVIDVFNLECGVIRQISSENAGYKAVRPVDVSLDVSKAVGMGFKLDGVVEDLKKLV